MLPKGGAFVKDFLLIVRGYYRLPRSQAASSSTGAATRRFEKGKGFALAGTGDAVETLSRD